MGEALESLRENGQLYCASLIVLNWHMARTMWQKGFVRVVLIFNYRCSDQTDGRRLFIRCRLRPGEKASRAPDGRPVLSPEIRTRAIKKAHGLQREHSLPGGYVWKWSKESGRSRNGQDIARCLTEGQRRSRVALEPVCSSWGARKVGEGTRSNLSTKGGIEPWLKWVREHPDLNHGGKVIPWSVARSQGSLPLRLKKEEEEEHRDSPHARKRRLSE